MNKLSGLTSLNESIAIYVPTTNGTSEPAEQFEIDIALDKAQSELAELFGGFTTVEGTGGYVAENGELVKEKVFIVRSNAASIEDWQVNNVVDVARVVRTWMNQECVSVEYNGKLYFV